MCEFFRSLWDAEGARRDVQNERTHDADDDEDDPGPHEGAPERVKALWVDETGGGDRPAELSGDEAVGSIRHAGARREAGEATVEDDRSGPISEQNDPVAEAPHHHPDQTDVARPEMVSQITAAGRPEPDEEDQDGERARNLDVGPTE